MAQEFHGIGWSEIKISVCFTSQIPSTIDPLLAERKAE